jgi:hypothetical protein
LRTKTRELLPKTELQLTWQCSIRQIIICNPVFEVGCFPFSEIRNRLSGKRYRPRSVLGFAVYHFIISRSMKIISKVHQQLKRCIPIQGEANILTLIRQIVINFMWNS